MGGTGETGSDASRLGTPNAVAAAQCNCTIWAQMGGKQPERLPLSGSRVCSLSMSHHLLAHLTSLNTRQQHIPLVSHHHPPHPKIAFSRSQEAARLDCSDDSKWDCQNLSYPFYWAIIRSEASLDGSELPQSTFTAIREYFLSTLSSHQPLIVYRSLQRPQLNSLSTPLIHKGRLHSRTVCR